MPDDGQMIMETKGLWRSEDRAKMRLIRAQYPDLRIVMILQNPRQRISKTSRTTNEQYARKIGLEVMSLDDLPLLLA